MCHILVILQPITKIERKENAYCYSYQFFYYLLSYVGFSKSIIKERKKNIKENDFFIFGFII